MMNMHAIVRSAITVVFADEKIMLYRSSGQVNVKGKITPSYALPIEVKAQIQTEGDSQLYDNGNTGQNDTIRKMYLMSQTTPQMMPAGIVRPFSRNGDIIKREDGTYWLVVAVEEDFSKAGWVSVRAQLQTVVPVLPV